MSVEVFGYDPDALGLVRGKYTKGNKVHVKCPFHEGHSGTSAVFYIDSGVLHCYKCSKRFKTSTIVNKTGGRIVKTKVKIVNEDELDNWEDILKNEIDISDSYLLSRGVTPEQIKRHQIRKTSKGVAIPIMNNNCKEVGIIVRQTDDFIRYLYGGERLPLWPMNLLKTYNPREPLYVVEGVFGALRGLKYNHNVVSSLGAMVKKDISLHLRSFKNVIGVFDNDDAGYIGGARLLKFVSQARIVVPGCPVDEMERDVWGSFATSAFKTNDINTLKSLVKKKDMFERFM